MTAAQLRSLTVKVPSTALVEFMTESGEVLGLVRTEIDAGVLRFVLADPEPVIPKPPPPVVHGPGKAIIIKEGKGW